MYYSRSDNSHLTIVNSGKRRTEMLQGGGAKDEPGREKTRVITRHPLNHVWMHIKSNIGTFDI